MATMARAMGGTQEGAANWAVMTFFARQLISEGKLPFLLVSFKKQVGAAIFPGAMDGTRPRYSTGSVHLLKGQSLFCAIFLAIFSNFLFKTLYLFI